MSTGSITASIVSQSTSVTALFAGGSGKKAAPVQAADPLQNAQKQAKEDEKLVEKLDRALQSLRGEKNGRPFVTYDRTGRFERPEPTAIEAKSAEISQTEISIGPDGISYSQTSLSYASLQTAGGSLTTASLNVTKAYISFGGNGGGGTPSTDVAA